MRLRLAPPLARRAALAALLAAALAAAGCGRSGAGPSAPAPSGPASSPTPPGGSSSANGAGGLTWASLGRLVPRSIQPNLARIAADPANPGLLAVCTAGAVRISRDGGAAWTEVSTAGVPAALAKTTYALPLPPGRGSPTPACAGALADPGRPGSVYAVFAAGKAAYGMPPVFHVAVATTDGGRSWRAVPPPAGFDPGGFGGFALRTAGPASVRALFGRVIGASPQKPAFALRATADGGVSWQDAALTCPAGGGPCLRWGPAPSGTGSCAMHAYPQPVEASADGGRTWAPAAAPGRADLANGCDLNEIVGLGAARALLVGRSAAARASVLLTQDGGRSWQPVALPPLAAGSSPAPGGVQLLPDGALLAVVSGQGGAGLPVVQLAPGAQAWCPVPHLALSGTYTNPATLQPAGGRLLWLEQDGQAGVPALKSAPLSEVHC